jgi:1,4-alpha-glucan branching enzyme
MKRSQGKAGKRRVTFKVRAPSAREVFVVGDFNNWNTQLHPLGKDEEGFWKVTLYLAPGKYEYKLLVDGRWWEGARDGKSVQNLFGTLNRLLVVPEKE